MNSFIARKRNPSVAQSVSALVAEGGKVLASDDAPVDSGRTLLETTMLPNTGTRRATSQFRVRQSSLLTPPEILLRKSAQRRPTLHLPARPAMTEKGSPNEQALPSKVSYRPRARIRAFH